MPPARAIALTGIAWDANASFLRGPCLAPAAVRRFLAAGSMNWATETGLDLENNPLFTDIGDITEPGNGALDKIQAWTGDHLDKGFRQLCLGGDHSITYPILKAYAARFPGLAVLCLDAHPDLYESFDGNPHSHASVFARVMGDRLVSRLVQVGVRTLNAPQREAAGRYGVEIIGAGQVHRLAPPVFDGPFYLSLDMDVMDPAFAPGVSHHEPGGLSSRQVIELIHAIKGQLVGADIVEFNPLRDPSGTTAALAAKLVKEIAGKMITSLIPARADGPEPSDGNGAGCEK